MESKADWERFAKRRARDRRWRENGGRKRHREYMREWRKTHPRVEAGDPNYHREQRAERYFRFGPWMVKSYSVDFSGLAVTNLAWMQKPTFVYIDSEGRRRFELWETAEQLIDRLKL